jgi:hypothetical protein
MLMLDVGGAEIAAGRVQPLLVGHLADEARQVGGEVVERLVCREKDGLGLDSPLRKSSFS